MHPDWLGSPQHVVGGIAVAFVAAHLLRRWIEPRWLIFFCAVSITALAEIAVELVEYPLLYSGEPHITAYYDTLADMAATIAGGLIGAALGLIRRRGMHPEAAPTVD